MNIDVLEPTEEGLPGGWKLSGWASVDELLAFRDEQRRITPENQVLFILDDEGQAAYTSMHACLSHRLDWPDTELLSAEENRLHEHEGLLSPARWAEAVRTNLLAATAAVDIDRVDGRLLPIDADEVDLIGLHDRPEAVFQSPVMCLTLQAEGPSMAIAARPNGYFTGDLTPPENYLLAERLRTRFGYEVLGLGSHLVAYIRPEPFDLEQVRPVIDSVRHLYRPMSDQDAERWANVAAGRRWLLLHYRGS